MPLHDHKCFKCERIEERFIPLGDLEKNQWCAACGSLLVRVFLKFPMTHVQPDICYDSPIDGQAITNKQARIEDLARNECIPYEPGMRQEATRRRAADEAALDARVEATVDEFVAKAPARKLEKLEQELRAGASAEVVRSTPEFTT